MTALVVVALLNLLVGFVVGVWWKAQRVRTSVPKHVHSFDMWDVTEPGAPQRRRCFGCGFVEVDNSGHQHNWGKWSHLNINLYKSGGELDNTVTGQQRTCLDCGFRETERIRAKNED